MAESISEIEQPMAAFIEATNERDYARLPEIMSEEFVWATPAAPGEMVRSPERAQDVMQKVVTGFPDFRAERLEAITSGDTGMAEVRFTGTHEGEYEGIPPTGEEFELLGVSKWRVKDGKLHELRDYANMQVLLEQLGVMDE